MCSNDLATSCDPWTSPDPCSPNYCADSICGLADLVLFDEELVGDAFDADDSAGVAGDFDVSFRGAVRFKLGFGLENRASGAAGSAS